MIVKEEVRSAASLAEDELPSTPTERAVLRACEDPGISEDQVL